MHCAKVRSLTETQAVFLCDRVGKALPIDLAASGVVRQRFVGQDRPQIGGTVCLIGREDRPAQFPRSMIVIRSRRLKVEDKNLESPQEAPDRLVI
jgi:hypothetical protein